MYVHYVLWIFDVVSLDLIKGVNMGINKQKVSFWNKKLNEKQ